MFKLFPFFQRHFKKCENVVAYIHQNSAFPLGVSLGGCGGTPYCDRPQGHKKTCTRPLSKDNYDDEETKGTQPPTVHTLQLLDRLVLKKVRTLSKTLGFQNQNGLLVMEFELTGENGERVAEIQLQRGDILEEFWIKVFNPNSELLYCTMTLKPDVKMKGLILCVHLNDQPQTFVGSVHEIRGMSKTSFINNSQGERIYQVFTHRGLGGFGWTNSAKILNSEGNEKLGDMQIVKRKGPDTLWMNLTLPLTAEKDLLNKLLVLGACLILMKD